MPTFVREGKTYWGGLHQQLGLLLYNPQRQRGVASDKVRLYIVAERRMALFRKDLVRAFLVPSRLETWWCAQHGVIMQPWKNARGTWWSHQVAQGTWCTGKARQSEAA